MKEQRISEYDLVELQNGLLSMIWLHLKLVELEKCFVVGNYFFSARRATSNKYNIGMIRNF